MERRYRYEFLLRPHAIVRWFNEDESLPFQSRARRGSSSSAADAFPDERQRAGLESSLHIFLAAHRC